MEHKTNVNSMLLYIDSQLTCLHHSLRFQDNPEYKKKIQELNKTRNELLEILYQKEVNPSFYMQ